MSEELLSRIEKLAFEDVVLAYSGGVDSALLLKLFWDACQKKGSAFYAVTIDSTLGHLEEVKEASRFAKSIGCETIVLKADPLKEAGLKQNPVNRCYLCKHYLFGLIVRFAKEKGARVIVDGTNADDLKVYRPGLKALSEYQIESPLAAANMTKAMVRQMAKDYGLTVSQKPSSPCLATRFPYGATLTEGDFKAVVQAESCLNALGFDNVRVRKYDQLARIEVQSKDFEKIIAFKEEIITKFKTFGFIYVTLDIEGFRSGSMDLVVKQ